MSLLTTQQARETFASPGVVRPTRTWARRVKSSPPNDTVVVNSCPRGNRWSNSATAGITTARAMGSAYTM